MAGPPARTNLAVTRDGATYNKLQRPDNLFEKSPALDKTNERKRECAAIDGHEVAPDSENKRAKTQHAGPTASTIQLFNDGHKHRSGAQHGENGMRMTLPIDEGELYDSDDSLGEALAYLRSVRQGAFYQDGAWISIDESHKTTYDEGDLKQGFADPQELYYKQLIGRFGSLRGTLSERVASKSTGLNAGSSQVSSKEPPSTRHEWLYVIDREYPSMAQVFQLDERSIRRGLEYCAHAMDRFDTISPQKSCWIWTLLALSGDVGTMDSEKISCIRELGNKAGEIRNNLIRDQNKMSEDRSIYRDLAGDENERTEPSRPDTRDASEDKEDLDSGYVRSDKKASEPETSLKKAILPRQGDAPLCTPSSIPSSGSCDNDERSNPAMNDTALKQARARLLAQLGDNLVQTGMPKSKTPITDEAYPYCSDQTGEDLDGPQGAVRKRIIPSRAEAERQRQMMRDSASSSTSGSPFGHAESSITTCPVGGGDTCISDINTRVTIDMILTVAAECYGQRDLLKFRIPW
ncbi:hypothetical protein E8E13_005103 [Curvularia kusanoi]|uniref:Uncharacterized protein n=1 Tax=Curvularia kusanoi TaxID=90978 RepID=A0A9P4THJ5_CURKU|nr:hypothetical protein E8E13_005103 [Curvularia kusanoi]